MLYLASKSFWFVAEPEHMTILLLVAGIALFVTGRRRLGAGLVGVTVLLLILVAALPMGTWLIAPLENRFSPPARLPANIDGVIMLGGDEDMAFRDLANRYPKAKLIYTGDPALDAGIPGLAFSGTRWMGIDINRVTFAPKSRNTFEDVIDAERIVHPSVNEIWILITPAFHMPRSVGLFRARGWQVLPYPVDYRTGPRAGVTPSPTDFEWNLTLVSIALKEWIGMLVNRIVGHSESWFPGPV